jgi:hypothetical protein
VSAQYALPFNPPDSFDSVFSKLCDSVKRGGVFVGQFFGPEDGWSKNLSISFHSEADIRKLLKSFAVLVLREEKRLGKTAVGAEKFWHVFHVIAKKK